MSSDEGLSDFCVELRDVAHHALQLWGALDRAAGNAPNEHTARLFDQGLLVTKRLETWAKTYAHSVERRERRQEAAAS